MNAAEIAETLLNGNIAQAREEILTIGRQWSSDGFPVVDPYNVAVLTLDVVAELADGYQDGEYPGDDTEPYLVALRKVRRCLEGAT